MKKSESDILNRIIDVLNETSDDIDANTVLSDKEYKKRVEIQYTHVEEILDYTSEYEVNLQCGN